MNGRSNCDRRSERAPARRESGLQEGLTCEIEDGQWKLTAGASENSLDGRYPGEVVIGQRRLSAKASYLGALLGNEKREESFRISAAQQKKFAVLHQNAKNAVKIRKKDDGVSSITKQELSGLISRQACSDDFPTWLEIRPLCQVHNNRRTQIHRRERKSPAKDIPPNKQAAVCNFETHMFGTIQNEERKDEQSGDNPSSPQGMLGLARQNSDRQLDNANRPKREASAHIPFSRRRSACDGNRCHHINSLARLENTSSYLLQTT